MSSRPTPANGGSGVSSSSSAAKAKSGRGAQPQSTAPGNPPARQPTQKQPSKSNTAGAPDKSNTESTTSAPVKHNTWIPQERIDKLNKEGKERVAKLSAEENNGAHREPSVQDALNKFKTAVEAEGNAKKAYMKVQSVLDNDPYLAGGDYYRGGMLAGPLGTTWEQAARSAALAYQKFKNEAGQ